MAEEAVSGVPLVGSRISLISKKNIRYEGVLYNINTSDASLALQNVRSFGTEGRVEGSVIPPSQVLHDFVCFRGQDIMDLHVHDAEADEPSQPPPPPLLPQPAAPAQFAQPPPPPGAPPPLLSPAYVADVAAMPPQPQQQQQLPPTQKLYQPPPPPPPQQQQQQQQPPPPPPQQQQQRPPPPQPQQTPTPPMNSSQQPQAPPSAAAASVGQAAQRVKDGHPSRQQTGKAGAPSPAASARSAPPAHGAQQTGATRVSSPNVAQAAGQAAQQNQRRGPAPQRQAPRSQQHQHPSQPTGAPRGRRNGPPRSRQPYNGGGAGRGAGTSSANGIPARTPGAMVGTGEALLNIRTKGGPAAQADGKGAASGPTAPEFDFQSELQKFDKEKELAKEMDGLNIVAHTSSSAAGGAGGAADGVKKYNKSSFFDEISCDVLDRAAGRPPRVTRAAEMDMNMDTFGTTGLQHARRRGGRGQNRNRARGGGGGGGGG